MLTAVALAGTALLGGSAGARSIGGSAAADATTTTRVVTDEDLEVLREATQSAYPEVKTADTDCIGNAALPHMSLATVGMLLRDAEAPIKATQEEQDALSEAIDACIDRSSVVQVIAGSAARLFADASSTPMLPSLTYNDLLCIDDEVGPLRAGETFFDLYRRPLELQQLMARSMSACVDEAYMRAALDEWLSFREWPVPIRLDQSTGTDSCVQSVLRDHPDVETLFEQVILAASPDELGDQVDELQDLLLQCGLPVPRDFGRGS